MCIYYIIQLVKKKKAEKEGAGYPQDGAPPPQQQPGQPAGNVEMRGGETGRFERFGGRIGRTFGGGSRW